MPVTLFHQPNQPTKALKLGLDFARIVLTASGIPCVTRTDRNVTMSDLSQKRNVILGGGSGSGRALGDELINAGATIDVRDSDADAGKISRANPDPYSIHISPSQTFGLQHVFQHGHQMLGLSLGHIVHACNDAWPHQQSGCAMCSRCIKRNQAG